MDANIGDSNRRRFVGMNFTRAESLTTGIGADGRIVSQSKDIRSKEDAQRQRMRDSRPEFRREAGGMAENVESSLEATAIEEAAARAALDPDQVSGHDPMPRFDADDFDIMAKERRAAKRVRAEDEQEYTSALAKQKAARQARIRGKSKQESLEMAVLGIAASSPSKKEEAAAHHRAAFSTSLIAVKAKPKSEALGKDGSPSHASRVKSTPQRDADDDEKVGGSLGALVSGYQSSDTSDDDDE
ncbi:hypothetical protein FOZ63_033174 [Perkinsus olseni]|uniref:Uncharacterized protein n=2 Tax=Perkinsus olseni TaxID=32597 RepID=A0A7J6TGJ3_PEROL|nr:hypothetical protein FOZ63_033174 [Perkinsus olseni]